jgi:hypothetical protein
MHLEAVIVQTWRPQSCDFSDILKCCDQVSLELHLEAVIERGWRYPWRPWSSKIGGVLGCGQSGRGSLGGRRGGR